MASTVCTVLTVSKMTTNRAHTIIKDMMVKPSQRPQPLAVVVLCLVTVELCGAAVPNNGGHYLKRLKYNISIWCFTAAALLAGVLVPAKQVSIITRTTSDRPVTPCLIHTYKIMDHIQLSGLGVLTWQLLAQRSKLPPTPGRDPRQPNQQPCRHSLRYEKHETCAP